jgi:hypothetical protein
MTINIVWSPTGFHIIDVFFKDSRFNAYNFVFVILQSIADWRTREVTAIDGKQSLYADNGRSHTMKMLLIFTEAEQGENGATSSLLHGSSAIISISFP